MSDRIKYLEQCELSLSPRITPCYTNDPHIIAFRAVCVDRIWRLGYRLSAHDSTVFSAVRLFDRCMTMMKNPISKMNMSMLCVSAFDIVFKEMDSDSDTLYIKMKGLERLDPVFATLRPLLAIYYKYGFLSSQNEYKLSPEQFRDHLFNFEMTVFIHVVNGSPLEHSPYEYLASCCPTWTPESENPIIRKTMLTVAAVTYSIHSTKFTSKQIAAAAVIISSDKSKFP